ncbi:MAG: hypothetical protein JSR99_08310 [Proteobacteria bacterium]|nr:hypothetical protein [Pseudomonadota bacterium]
MSQEADLTNLRKKIDEAIEAAKAKLFARAANFPANGQSREVAAWRKDIDELREDIERLSFASKIGPPEYAMAIIGTYGAG